MPTAHQVASDLRNLADSLDAQPNADIQTPWISFHCYSKESFLAIAQILPRPLAKKIQDEGKDYARLTVECKGLENIDINASVPQSQTCELIEPAKPAVYRCEPLLSEIEEAAL